MLRLPLRACLLALVAACCAAPTAQAAVTAVPVTDAGALAFAQALAGPQVQLTSATFVSAPPRAGSTAVADSGAPGLPTDGTTFGILANGMAANPSDSDLQSPSASRGMAYDVTVVRLGLTVPQGANCLTLNYNYAGQDGAVFVEPFVAELDQTSWTIPSQGVLNAPAAFGAITPGNTPMTSANRFYNLSFGSGLRSVATQITPGPHHLYLSFADGLDRVVTNLVALDSLRIGAVADPATNCRPGAVVSNGPTGGTPAISGRPYQGKTLTASPGTWSGNGPFTYAYRWQRCNGPACTAIPGATGAQYTVTADDLDRRLAVVVTVTDAGGQTANATSAQTQTIGSYTRVVLADEPIAYWRLGDAQDTSRMTDSTGRHHGEYKNGAGGSPQQGISGDGNTTAIFTGNGTYGFVNGLHAPQAASTIEGWVKPSDSGDAMIFQQGGAGALFVRGGRLVFRQVDTDISAPAPAPGQFSHVAGTWDGHTARLYIDGVQVASGPATKAPSGAGTLYLAYGDQAPWLRGYLDEVAYYGRALSAAALLEHFEADPPPPLLTPTGPAPQEPAAEEAPAPREAPAAEAPAESASAEPAPLVAPAARAITKQKANAKRRAVKKKKRAPRRKARR